MEREQVQMLWDGMNGLLDEKQRRQYAATLAKAYGYGGATVVYEITGTSMNTITRGKKELENPQSIDSKRVRSLGGGPKWTEEKYPDMQAHIQKIVEEDVYRTV